MQTDCSQDFVRFRNRAGPPGCGRVRRRPDHLACRRAVARGLEQSDRPHSAARAHASKIAATAIEYGLIAALIAVGIIGAARLLGSQISATFNSVVAAMQSA